MGGQVPGPAGGLGRCKAGAPALCTSRGPGRSHSSARPAGGGWPGSRSRPIRNAVVVAPPGSVRAWTRTRKPFFGSTLICGQSLPYDKLMHGVERGFNVRLTRCQLLGGRQGGSGSGSGGDRRAEPAPGEMPATVVCRRGLCPPAGCAGSRPGVSTMLWWMEMRSRRAAGCRDSRTVGFSGGAKARATPQGGGPEGRSPSTGLASSPAPDDSIGSTPRAAVSSDGSLGWSVAFSSRPDGLGSIRRRSSWPMRG
jgi:hypothetical protein